MRFWAVTLIFSLAFFALSRVDAQTLREKADNAYIYVRNGVAADIGGARDCKMILYDDLDALRCSSHNIIKGSLADSNLYTGLAERLVLSDLTTNAENSIECHLPYLSKYVASMSSAKPSPDASDLTSSAFAKFQEKAAALAKITSVIDQLEKHPPGSIPGYVPGAQEIKNYETKLEQLTGARDTYLANMPLGNVASVRDSLYDLIRTGPVDQAHFAKAYVSGVAKFRDDLAGFQKQIKNAKPKDDQHDMYDFSKLAAWRETLMRSESYDNALKAAGAGTGLYQKLACRRNAEFKIGPDRLGKIASAASLVAMAASFGSSAVAEGGLLALSGGARVALQVGITTGQLGFGAAKSFSQCDQGMTYIPKAGATCTDKAVFDGIIGRANAKKCYSDIAQTAVLAAGSAAGLVMKAGKSVDKALAEVEEAPKVANVENTVLANHAAAAPKITTLPPNPQLEIWKLEDAGHVEQANALREAVREHLSTAKIVSNTKKRTYKFAGQKVTEYISGENGARWVELEDGTRAIWKPARNEFTARGESEVAVSKIDEMLGSGLVPVTVSRKLGKQDGILQIFVEDANKGMRNQSAPEFVPENLRWFDTLIYNTDRKAANSLRTEGRTVAIDHGQSLQQDARQQGHVENIRFNEDVRSLMEQETAAKKLKIPKVDPPDTGDRNIDRVINATRNRYRTAAQPGYNRLRAQNMMPTKAVYERLKAITDDQWKTALRETGVEEHEIEHFADRRRAIIDTVEAAKKQWGDSILREGQASALVSQPRQLIRSRAQDALKLRDDEIFGPITPERMRELKERAAQGLPPE